MDHLPNAPPPMSRRLPLLLLLIGVGLAMALLSAGLSQLELPAVRDRTPPVESPAIERAPRPPGADNVLTEKEPSPRLRPLLLSLPLLLVALYLYRAGFRPALKLALLVLLLLLAILLLNLNPPRLPTAPSGAMDPAAEPAAEPAGGSSAVPARWLVPLLSLGLTVALAAGLVGAARLVQRRLKRLPEGPLERLGHEAQGALGALSAGADLRDAVLRCYLAMARVLDASRGLQRRQGMTPREFAQQLTHAGLPAAHVQELTGLFEAVRYGARVSDDEERSRAVSCLQAIVQVCNAPRNSERNA